MRPSERFPKFGRDPPNPAVGFPAVLRGGPGQRQLHLLEGPELGDGGGEHVRDGARGAGPAAVVARAADERVEPAPRGQVLGRRERDRRVERTRGPEKELRRVARERAAERRERLGDGVEEARAVEQEPGRAVPVPRREREQVARRGPDVPEAGEEALRGPGVARRAVAAADARELALGAPEDRVRAPRCDLGVVAAAGAAAAPRPREEAVAEADGGAEERARRRRVLAELQEPRAAVQREGHELARLELLPAPRVEAAEVRGAVRRRRRHLGAPREAAPVGEGAPVLQEGHHDALVEVAGKRRLGQRCPALAPARGERGAVLRPTGRRRRVPTPGRGPRRGHQTEVPNVHDGRKVIVIPLELGY